jgi:hypothetical protein
MIFSICNEVSPERVVDVIESAAESSLSGDDTMAFTKVAYRSYLIIANPFFIFLYKFSNSPILDNNYEFVLDPDGLHPTLA